MKYRLIKIKNEWLMKGEKMKAIAMFNNKGGVGKTTLTCNLSAYIARTATPSPVQYSRPSWA